MEKMGRNPPYKESAEDFGKWFREAAKEKWTNYLFGNERDITTEERDAMRSFLIEYGTDGELQQKLDSFTDARKLAARETLREEIKSRRPEFKPRTFEDR